MKLKIMAIHDAKVQAFAQPFYARSTGEGMREFENIFSSTDPRAKDSNYQKHPGDFNLYEIGEFDDETGELIPSKHVSLARGSSFTQSSRFEVTNGQA